jgi:hypothetical protein
MHNFFATVIIYEWNCEIRSREAKFIENLLKMKTTASLYTLHALFLAKTHCSFLQIVIISYLLLLNHLKVARLSVDGEFRQSLRRLEFRVVGEYSTTARSGRWARQWWWERWWWPHLADWWERAIGPGQGMGSSPFTHLGCWFSVHWKTAG